MDVFRGGQVARPLCGFTFVGDVTSFEASQFSLTVAARSDSETNGQFGVVFRTGAWIPERGGQVWVQVVARHINNLASLRSTFQV